MLLAGMVAKDDSAQVRTFALFYATAGVFFLVPPFFYWHAGRGLDLVSIGFAAAHFIMATATWRLSYLARIARIGVFAASVVLSGWALDRFGTTLYAWGFRGTRVPDDIIWVALLFQVFMAFAYTYFAVMIFRVGIAR